MERKRLTDDGVRRLSRLTKGDKGRDEVGRFIKGCKGGPGNPFAKRVGELRSALFAESTIDDMRKVVRRLITMAQEGDVPAAKVWLERVLGKLPDDVLSFMSAENQSDPEPDLCFL